MSPLTSPVPPVSTPAWQSEDKDELHYFEDETSEDAIIDARMFLFHLCLFQREERRVFVFVFVVSTSKNSQWCSIAKTND